MFNIGTKVSHIQKSVLCRINIRDIRQHYSNHLIFLGNFIVLTHKKFNPFKKLLKQTLFKKYLSTL